MKEGGKGPTMPQVRDGKTTRLSALYRDRFLLLLHLLLLLLSASTPLSQNQFAVSCFFSLCGAETAGHKVRGARSSSKQLLPL